MYIRKLILIVFVFVVPGLNISIGQYMHVKEITGTQSDYSISTLSKIHFSPGSLIISYPDNSNEEFALGDIRYLSFSDSTIVNIEEEKEPNMKLYPNPFSYELNVELSETSSHDWQVDIIGLDGRKIKTILIRGPGINTLDLSFLPAGSYICHFRNENETKSYIVVKR